MTYFDAKYSKTQLLLVMMISVVLTAALTVYPLNEALVSWRPMLLIMVLIFWRLYQPRYIGVVAAFVIGLIADLLMDTLLGQQAFAAVLAIVVLSASRRRTQYLAWLPAWLLAVLGLSVFQSSLWLLQSIEQPMLTEHPIESLLTSSLLWPLLWLLLRRFTA